MLEWLQRHPWSLGEVLALAGVVAPIAVAVIGPLRRRLGKWVRAGRLRAGRDERRYAAWFVDKWGQYENPYLADTENLDLNSTYVSLSFQVADTEQETRYIATKVLADRRPGNLIIEGAPGSGKSTLLKAYGVGVLKVQRRALWLRQRPQDIPFFVQLRKFARDLDRLGSGLDKYLIDEVLVSEAGMALPDATEFLRYALTEGRALVMLDGLDEVTADRYAAVLEAVHKFTTDRNPHRPTHQARIIVTCRRQNFLSLRDEWAPVIAKKVCTLAPLRNSEIFNYLDRLRTKFRTPGGPESFFQAVRASGTLDLHRVPLILAMSVGLYARKDFFEIPNSIAKLYRSMIEEMLDRQRFKRDPGGNALVFQVDDKYRFLREFALETALRPEGFDDFERKDLATFAQGLASHLNEVIDPHAFVKEIIDRSGLLSDVSETGRYVFAHRSIHEYLAAEELRLIPDGDTTLLRRATDPEWRQVILFYATAEEQRSVDGFLRELSKRNITLAGHCLGGAKASNEVATTILESLRTADPVNVAALAAATMSPRRAVHEMAVDRLETQLSASIDVVSSAFSGDVDGMLPLLGSLAGSNAARIAALVPRIVASIPDDPRLVEPLWRCLAASEIEEQQACRTIVERLLTIVMDPDGLNELEKQEPYTRPFLTNSVRHQAYPFDDGFPATSNLVTLLAWAQHLDVAPLKPNRFFEAKRAGRLARVETDKRRTLSVCLFWPGRILSAAGTLLSVAAAAIVVSLDWRVLLLPIGWLSPLLSLAAAAAPFGIIYFLDTRVSSLFSYGSWARRYLTIDISSEYTSHFMGYFDDKVDSEIIFWTGLYLGPLAYTVAVTPLAAWSVPGYLAAAILGPLVLFWFPILDLFARTSQFYIYRPNPYIDMYDEPSSQHWLQTGVSKPLTVELTETNLLSTR
ncbi:MAG: NACHT domain-containing protein [Pseudonocardiaceae bacterium]